MINEKQKKIVIKRLIKTAKKIESGKLELVKAVREPSVDFIWMDNVLEVVPTDEIGFTVVTRKADVE